MKNLKETFIANAESYALAMRMIFEEKVEGGEYKNYSRLEKSSTKKCHDIFLKMRDDGTLKELEPYMLHESEYVRYLTAAYCLYSHPELAEKILEDLIEARHPISFHALGALKGWRGIPWTENRYK
jgi:hypothetical protein